MIHHTENTTTTRVGQSIATVIADTISPAGKRITTLELVYPRYFHSELLTHRQFSRNASSSRATPLSVTLKEVRDDPVFFDYVGVNQAGMVAGAELDPAQLLAFKSEWEGLGFAVASKVEFLSKKYGIHKQTLNRALEPWLRIRTLVTATDWDNFFKLRLAPDAQPEIRSLAQAMQKAMAKSTPKIDVFHTPYVDNRDQFICTRDSAAASVARCARVSYARLDGRDHSIEDDIALRDRLLSSGHLSPFEHFAFDANGRHANFDGWKSLRRVHEEEERPDIDSFGGIVQTLINESAKEGK